MVRKSAFVVFGLRRPSLFAPEVILRMAVVPSLAFLASCRRVWTSFKAWYRASECISARARFFCRVPGELFAEGAEVVEDIACIAQEDLSSARLVPPRRRGWGARRSCTASGATKENEEPVTPFQLSTRSTSQGGGAWRC